MKKYPKRSALIRQTDCSSAKFKQLWQELIESEVHARKIMQHVMLSADGANAAFLQNEIHRRKEFLLELICNEVLSDD